MRRRRSAPRNTPREGTEDERAHITKRLADLVRAVDALERADQQGPEGLTRVEWSSLRSASKSARKVFELLRKRQATGEFV